MEIIENELGKKLEERIEALIDRKVEEALRKKFQDRKGAVPRLAIVVSKGTLEAAYPPLILATTAIALGMEAALFFTFFGLHILKKGSAESLRFVPLGNPATPMPMPNILSVLPGMTALATFMMKKTIQEKQIASIPELFTIAKESGVKLWPCQMTMDMMGIERSELIDGLDEPVGAATFLSYAADASISLFV
ncbi:MAG TPA: DsrE/DsrF/DrsH-like family protein [Candidatus Manganitrophaceae bacterium]|nr:DsrE/DsrF/DrsH-like family protein [Candidatus Manganitrophaceae bacterium]